jgi:Carboxypeptidase regulatory-like domain/TonB dependent receptor
MMSNSKQTVVVAVILLLACFTVLPSAVAQTDRGTITGTVTDPTGAVIVGAKVTATNAATQASSSTTSTTSGNYTIPLLRAGTYEVTVEQAGFKKAVLTGIQLQVGQTARVDAALQLGETSQAVQVTADTIQLQTETSDRGTVVTGREVLDLPIVGQGEQRNPAFFINLSPGVTSRGTSTPTASGSGRQLNTTVNGSPSGSTEFYLDGAQIGNPGLLSGDFRNLPFPQDVVAEFKIMTNAPPAEYGRAGLGITAFNLRSGTNQLHGSVYEYLRNDKLDARGFFAPRTPLNKQNEFGATAGGPILRDKTFFYGWYQGFRLRKEVSNSLDTVPTEAMRGGNLSNVLGGQVGTDAVGRPVFASQIFDPATTRTVAAGATDPVSGRVNTSGSAAVLRDGFGFSPTTGLPTAQANIIPSARIDPVARAMFAQFPNPTLPGQQFGYTNNWLSQFKAQSSINQWGAKVDHSFTSNNKMMGEFLWLRNHAPTGSKWPGAISEGGTNDSGQYVVRVSHDLILRPNLINHWVAGYNRWRNDSFPESGLGWPAKLGFKGVPQEGAGSTFPQLIIGGLGNVYARGGQGYSATNNYSFDNGLTWIKSKHTFKTGFSYIKFQENGGNFNAQSGRLNFGSGYTALPGVAFNDNCSPGGTCTGMGAASFLLGGVSSATASINTAVAAERAGQYAAYLQDDFKATSKLTLNLGIRYDLMLPTVNAHNQRSWMDPFAINPDIGIRGAMVFATDSRRAAVKAFTKAFGPRFGFAYSLNDKTVVRGGYGIMYTGGGNNRTAGTQFLQGYNANFDEPVQNGGLDAAFLLRDGWPSFRHRPPPFISPSYGLGTGPLGALGDGRLPDIQNWHLSVQRELPGKMLIDVGYVGTKGTHLPSRLNPTTAVDSKYLTLGDALFKPIGDPTVQALPVVQAMPVDPGTGNRSPFRGFENLWKGNAVLAQALRPFPQFGKDTPNNGLAQLRDFGETSGLSTYHALQVQARKQMSMGLSFLVSYTWSKTLTNAESIFNEFSGFTQDPYNRKAEKALSLLDFPNNLVVSYQYELPFGKGKKFANSGAAVNKVLGGWSIAAVQQYTSGAPQGVTVGNSLDPYFGPNGFLTRPNVNPGVNKRSQAYLNGTWDPNGVNEAGSLFNINAWTNPQAANRFSFGNAPRTDGDIRRFPYYNEDVSIIKRTNLTERVSMEFRADFLNIFNRTVFGFDQGGDQYGNTLQGMNADFGVGSFGHVTSQGNFPREVQFGLKINY